MWAVRIVEPDVLLGGCRGEAESFVHTTELYSHQE